ncbi:MAG: efflux RND transporter periplasmic adaptor subunit [Prosthecobacter sp.]
MKKLISILLVLFVSLLSNCSRTMAVPTDETTSAVESGAQFKEGHGLTLSSLMERSIDLKTAEVTEAAIAPSFTAPFQALQSGSTEATSWVPEKQAALLKPGMTVDLDYAGRSIKATVLRFKKSPYVTLGDTEVTLQASEPLDEGTPIQATFSVPAGGPVSAIPRSALLTTVEGTYAYVKNDAFFVRTPIKIGDSNTQYIAVTDGLYTGDEVVTTGVLQLWLAELQFLRGGKACTCD